MNTLVLHPSEIDRRLACSYRASLWATHEAEFLMTPSMLLGRAFHKTVSGDCLSYANSHAFQHPADLLDQAGQFLKREYEEFSGRVELTEDSDYIPVFARLRQTIGIYTSYVRSLPWFKPIATEVPVEKAVSFIEGTVLIRGKLDIIVENGSHVELKTKSSLPSTYNPATSVQNLAYLYCMSMDDKPVSKIVMVGTKFPTTTKGRRNMPPKFRIYDADFNQAKWMKVIKSLQSLLLESNAHLSHPAPQGDHSPCDYCGGRRICAYYLGDK